MTIKNDLRLLSDYVFIDYTDTLKMKLNFTCVKDSLCKDNLISEKTYYNAYLSIDKKRQKTYIKCGSYSLLVKE